MTNIGGNDVPTIEEQLALADWLRRHGGIGVGCVNRDDPDTGCHLPELCEAEQQEYLQYFAFEMDLRAAGPAGEWACFTIHQAVKDDWRRLYDEDYDGPVMQERLQAYFDSPGLNNTKESKFEWRY